MWYTQPEDIKSQVHVGQNVSPKGIEVLLSSEATAQFSRPPKGNITTSPPQRVHGTLWEPPPQVSGPLACQTRGGSDMFIAVAISSFSKKNLFSDGQIPGATKAKRSFSKGAINWTDIFALQRYSARVQQKLAPRLHNISNQGETCTLTNSRNIQLDSSIDQPTSAQADSSGDGLAHASWIQCTYTMVVGIDTYIYICMHE